MTPAARIRFHDAYIPEPNTGCLLWTKLCRADGLGVAWTGERTELAHRIAWKLARGPIPDRRVVVHRCGVPACVNPYHLVLGAKATSTSERSFWNRSIPEPNTGCMLFDGHLNRHGYGRLGFGGRRWLAHRLAWYLSRGEDPGERIVCHRCDTPACVNPAHLFLGTQLDNVRDMIAKGRHCQGEARSHAMRAAHRRNPMVGERASATRLREAEVLAIRSSPLGAKHLSRIYGVSVSTISHAKSGRSWRHLNRPGSRQAIRFGTIASNGSGGG